MKGCWKEYGFPEKQVWGPFRPIIGIWEEVREQVVNILVRLYTQSGNTLSLSLLFSGEQELGKRMWQIIGRRFNTNVAKCHLGSVYSPWNLRSFLIVWLWEEFYVEKCWWDVNCSPTSSLSLPRWLNKINIESIGRKGSHRLDTDLKYIRV